MLIPIYRISSFKLTDVHFFQLFIITNTTIIIIIVINLINSILEGGYNTTTITIIFITIINPISETNQPLVYWGSAA